MAGNLIVLAGPNGAGKTTFFLTFLKKKGLPFINADVIAEELRIDAYEAAEVAEGIRRDLLDRGESFIAETVFSDPVGAKVAFLKEAVEAGYNVTLLFIGLESAVLSQARVLTRVESGGHDVPPEKIQKRYARTLANLERSIEVLPRVLLFDNSLPEHPYRLIAEFRNGKIHRLETPPVPAWAEPLLKFR